MHIHDLIPRFISPVGRAILSILPTSIIATTLFLVLVTSRPPAMAAVLDPFEGGPADPVPIQRVPAATQIPLPDGQGTGEGSSSQQNPTSNPANVSKPAQQEIRH